MLSGMTVWVLCPIVPSYLMFDNVTSYLMSALANSSYLMSALAKSYYLD